MAETYRIGLDVGGTKVLGAVFDRDRNVVYRLKKKSTEQGAEAENVEQVIVSVVEEMLDASGIPMEQISAIASSIPGVIDQKAGVVLFTPNLPWRDYDIRSAMEKRFGVPFFIGNDVNLGRFDIVSAYRCAGSAYKECTQAFDIQLSRFQTSLHFPIGHFLWIFQKFFRFFTGRRKTPPTNQDKNGCFGDPYLKNSSRFFRS